MKRYTKLLLLYTLVLSMALSGCEDLSYTDTPSKEGTVSLQLDLLVPGQRVTRAMGESQESEIDYATLQVLVFEATASGDVFRYQARITNRSEPTVTIEVLKSSAAEKYRFVVLANASQSSIDEGTSKSDALNKFTFSCMKKWNASSTTSAKMPMWGELSDPIQINADLSITVGMNRALARVDVGTLFKFRNKNPITGDPYDQAEKDKESVWGLSNFKLKEIRVYRTHSKGYVASTAEKMSSNEPHVPSPVTYNSDDGTVYTTLAEADGHPLLYTLETGAESYVREIYIPESTLASTVLDMDNAPCIVVGGYYGESNTSVVTYYRADFAEYVNNVIDTYIPILRNHRYVFDIRSVSAPGTETPEQALNVISTPLQLNVVNWDEVPLNHYTQGNYYFGVDNRYITMEARAPKVEMENTYTIAYRTNLALDGTTGKELNYSWNVGTHFEVVSIDYNKKTITIKAKSNNTDSGAQDRDDVLTVNVENMQVKFYVKQKAFVLNYTINCAEVEVHGKYRVGVPLNYTNFLTVSVTTIGSSYHGEEYELKTVPLHGIYFEGKGTFDVSTGVLQGDGGYKYTLKLEGYNTLINDTEQDRLAPFLIQIISNSVDPGATCEARIITGYDTKKVLAIGANAIYKFGYMLEPGSGSRAFVDAGLNFGTMPNSTVTMETNLQGNAFTIEVMSVGQGMAGESLIYNNLLQKINSFKPDIILTGQAINYFTSGADPGPGNQDAIDLLKRFVDAGGVFLMFNEYYPFESSITTMIKAIMESESISGSNVTVSGADQLLTFQGDSDDPIVNGPFGNMNGKKWGSDGTALFDVTGLSGGDVTIYTSRTAGHVAMFRHKTKPFFFVGDGGFISNNKRYIGATYPYDGLYFPFAIDAQYRPIARTNYTSGGVVYNSQIFGNILAWAVDYAETKGIKYDKDPMFP